MAGWALGSAGQGLNLVADFVNIFLEHCMKDSEDQLIFLFSFSFIKWSMKRFWAKLFGIECEVKGREHLESDDAYILVLNHQSSLDCIGKILHSFRLGYPDGLCFLFL